MMWSLIESLLTLVLDQCFLICQVSVPIYLEALGFELRTSHLLAGVLPLQSCLKPHFLWGDMVSLGRPGLSRIYDLPALAF
jgi:hypothetical protein